MVDLYVTGGVVTKVSALDGPRLSRYAWHLCKGYVVRSEKRGQRCRTIYLHREVRSAPPGLFVDHRDGDKLNNCRSNLRVCTNAQNRANARRNRNNVSGVKGVHRHGTKWRAQIRVDGRLHHLGLFAERELAGAAYFAAAKRYFRNFARQG